MSKARDLADLIDTVDANANNYIHPTDAGNKHIPTGGTEGQILENSASGTAVWTDLPEAPTPSIFPAFTTSTWTSMTFTTSGSNKVFTAPTGGNGIFFVASITFRSSNTAVYGSFSTSMTGTGSYCTFGGTYGGFVTSSGSSGVGGTVAGNPIQHGVQGFIAAGGTLNLNSAAPYYNMYFAHIGQYKSV